MSTENINQLLIERSKLWTHDLDKLLRRWRRQIGIRRKSHYDVARNFSKKHYWFGLPTIIITTLASTGTLSTFENCERTYIPCTENEWVERAIQFGVNFDIITQVVNGTLSLEMNYHDNPDCKRDELIRIIIGVISLFGVILSALMTFINYQESANEHKTSGDNYDSLYGKIDSLLIIPGPLRGDPVTCLTDIRSSYDELVKKSPPLNKDHEVELSYTTLNETFRNRPSKNSEDIFSQKRGNDILRDIIISHDPPKNENAAVEKNNEIYPRSGENSLKGFESSEGSENSSLIDEIIKKNNEFDSEDENQEVCIGFDIETLLTENDKNTAIAIASLNRSRSPQSISSLKKLTLPEKSKSPSPAEQYKTQFLNEPSISIERNTDISAIPFTEKRLNAKVTSL